MVKAKADRHAISEASTMLGEEMANLGWSLIVGTDIPESVDRHVINGAIKVARKRRRKVVIDVYYIEQDGQAPYSDLEGNSDVSITFHPVLSLQWHVAHLRAAEKADAVLLIAGSRGTLVSGLLSMLHGIPFLPVVYFGHAAREVWEVARTDVGRYFFDVSSPHEIERVISHWSESISPKGITGLLKRLVSARRKQLMWTRSSTLLAGGALCLGMVAYLALLFTSRGSPSIEFGLFKLALGAVFAGVFFSGFKNLIGLKVSGTYEAFSVVDILLGAGGGFIGAMIIPIAQLLAKGAVSSTLAWDEYLRFWFLAGIAGMYGAMSAEGIVQKVKKAAERLRVPR